jgi:hypothetical protein
VEEAHPRTTHYSWDESKGIFEFSTKPLIGINQPGGQAHRLGRFFVQAWWEEAANRLRVSIENLDRGREREVHPCPNVGPDWVCLGNMTADLEALFLARDWWHFINLMINELCNLSEPVDPRRWPLMPRDSTNCLVEPEAVHAATEQRLDQWFPARVRQGWRIVIAGLGTIGSEVAPAVARCLFTDVWLFDPQRLEPGNFGVQGYSWTACVAGWWKVTAARRLMSSYPCAEKLVTIPQPLNRHEAQALRGGPPVILLTGLDSISGRRDLWQSIRPLGIVQCLIDGRLAGPFVEVRTVDFASPRSVAYYQQTAFPKIPHAPDGCGQNAYPGSRLVVAGLMMDQLHAFLARELMTPIQTMNLQATRSGHNPMINWRLPEGGR